MLKTTIYQDKKLKTSIILFILSALMIGFSVYLTQHYFDLKFPTGLESKSLCNVNQFFNCDKTSLSLFGNFLGVPIALFGVVIGLLVMVGLIVKMDDIGLNLAQRSVGAVRAFGRGLVKAMPIILNALSVIGIAAMIWVGGGIILHGMHEFHITPLPEMLDHFSENAGAAVPSLSGLVTWLVHAIGSGIFGVIIGGVIVAVHHMVTKKA